MGSRMTRSAATLLLGAAGLSLLVACGDGGSGGGTPAAAPSFDVWAKGFAASPDRDVFLSDPAAWFAAHFPGDLASVLAADYQAEAAKAKGSRSFGSALRQAKEKGNTEVKTAAFRAAIDRNANALQNAALQRMSTPATLYTLRLTKPGEETGSTFWSFVEAEGDYRFVGKMRTLNPTRGDLVADILSSLPLGVAEAELKDKGLLTTSAVEYLQKVGILK